MLTTAALTIAGSDCCGGAGIQADLKTFVANGVYGASVITALTAQNTLGVQALTAVKPDMVRAQLLSVLADLPIRAVKTGMLGSAATIAAVADILGAAAPGLALVMDPVMVATSGAELADAATIAAMRRLIGMATLVTPNTRELETLTGMPATTPAEARAAGRRLLAQGCQAVLLKGGHLPGREVADVLLADTGEKEWAHARLAGEYHGTGCTLSAAITAGLAKNRNLVEAVGAAIDYLGRTMRAGRLPRAGRLILLQHDA
jgi:hydroxymethylpyrimidine/phosphomethylpyrimidine kinase